MQTGPTLTIETNINGVGSETLSSLKLMPTSALCMPSVITGIDGWKGGMAIFTLGKYFQETIV